MREPATLGERCEIVGQFRSDAVVRFKVGNEMWLIKVFLSVDFPSLFSDPCVNLHLTGVLVNINIENTGAALDKLWTVGGETCFAAVC